MEKNNNKGSVSNSSSDSNSDNQPVEVRARSDDGDDNSGIDNSPCVIGVPSVPFNNKKCVVCSKKTNPSIIPVLSVCRVTLGR